MIHTGDCVTVMATFEAESVDAVVTDPPYHLRFMGRAWDTAESPQHQEELHKAWATEAFRVLKSSPSPWSWDNNSYARCD